MKRLKPHTCAHEEISSPSLKKTNIHCRQFSQTLISRRPHTNKCHARKQQYVKNVVKMCLPVCTMKHFKAGDASTHKVRLHAELVKEQGDDTPLKTTYSAAKPTVTIKQRHRKWGGWGEENSKNRFPDLFLNSNRSSFWQCPIS